MWSPPCSPRPRPHWERDHWGPDFDCLPFVPCVEAQRLRKNVAAWLASGVGAQR